MFLPSDRRAFLKQTAAGLSALALGGAALRADQSKDPPKDPPKEKPTEFRIACMTYTYNAFPLERALTGIQGAGYKYVAWGTEHKEEDGKKVPVMAPDAAPDKAKELAKRCRDLGLEPVMMFST